MRRHVSSRRRSCNSRNFISEIFQRAIYPLPQALQKETRSGAFFNNSEALQYSVSEQSPAGAARALKLPRRTFRFEETFAGYTKSPAVNRKSIGDAASPVEAFCWLAQAEQLNLRRFALGSQRYLWRAGRRRAARQASPLPLPQGWRMERTARMRSNQWFTYACF